MKLRSFLSLLLLFTHGPLLGQTSPHVIAFFIRPLPVSHSPAVGQSSTEQKQTGETSFPAKPVLSKAFTLPYKQSGMYATYAGTLTHTAPDGKILFERKTADTKLRILITDKLKPVPINPLSEKTISGFILGPKAHAQQYSFERLQDPETETYAWYVTPEKIDREKRIPYDTIILFANPAQVIVPVGPTATRLNENLVLPDFYVTEEFNSALNALNFLKIRQYFSPLAFDSMFLPNGYQKKISA